MDSTYLVTNLNADLLDGQHGSAFALSTHNHDAGYVNVTGDSMSGATSSTVLSVSNTGTGNGVSGTASGPDAWGVHGYARNAGDVTNYGGYFEAAGNGGRGVSGIASGTRGKGVYGSASNAGDVENYGGLFEAAGSSGRGVYGYASGTQGRGVYDEATGTSGVGIYGNSSSISSWDFYAGGNGGNYGGFTGGHEVKLSENFPVDIKPGMIVSVTGQARIRRQQNGTPTLSSTLPTVNLSSRTADKAVFGVFMAEAPLPKVHWYQAKEGERFATVNALGEGRVWVSNINGNIEAGDYITTSGIPGYGQRQDAGSKMPNP